MPANRQHRGIERKILTSIVWVGLLPVLFALVISYFAARWGRSQETQESLAATTQQTAVGLKLAISSLRHSADVLGHAVQDDIFGPEGLVAAQLSPEQIESLRVRLQRDVDLSEGPSIIRVLDAYGNLLVSTEPAETPAQFSLPPEDVERWQRLEEPNFVSFDWSLGFDSLKAELVAPIFDPSETRILGFISETVDITPMLKYAFGRDPFNLRTTSRDNYFQIVYKTADRIAAAGLRVPEPGAAPVLERAETGRELEAALRQPGNNYAGSMQVANYPTPRGNESVFLSYYRLLEEPGVYESYILVYRPSSVVYANINTGAGVAFVLCVIFIAFMCLNAYRNVHNNIVRPVSLLNEGAQIIGQGDLELKLKIDTGDEIEELATSFNKMALDLNRNIGQLEESEERYRSLVTSMRDGIFHADTQGKIMFINNAGVEIFGFSNLKESTGQELLALFRDATDYTRIMEELRENGFVERSRIFMKRIDGREICVELSGNQVYDDDGEVTGIEGIFRDVTKSVQLEQEARERSERIAAINQIANVINSSLEAGRLYESLVVEVKKLVDFDFAALDLLNEPGEAFETRQLWPAQAQIEKSAYPVDDEQGCAAWVARHRECLTVGNLREPVSPFASQFPEEIHACVSIPLYATGRIIGTLNLGGLRPDAFSHHDVEVLEQMAPHIAVAIRNANLLENLQQSLEEVTRAREKLHEVNEELKTLDEMKTNLLSNVSHELRTPLVSVMGYTDMIINGKVGPVTDTQREYLQISLRNIDKLVTLIENLLDFSRLHRGTETLVFDTFDLVDCARASLQIMQPVSESRNIKLVLDAPDEPVLVEGDKGKLGQVFNNLLSNAVKFNSPGGTVSVTITPTTETINVAVSDTGIGIPQDALDKVFTRFYQYDSSSTRKYGGTGIGLAIAQDIARLHGTRITVSSTEGEGSTFRFALPNPAARKDRRDAELPMPTETQLLIEVLTRDRALLAQLRSLLEPEGMEIINATTTANAETLAKRHRPDCIVVDVDHADAHDKIVPELLASPTAGALPIILITNDEPLYTKFRQDTAARLKRDFRKSTLLSSIRYALNQGAEAAEPFGNKVLCVDDDQEILTFIRRCLEPEGYEVETVETGEECIRRVASREYGLVLLDIAMPGLDGWETCRRIKNNPKLAGIKVCMVTAKPVDTSKEHNRDAGADGFLFKPFRPEDLLDLVKGLESLQAGQQA